MEFCPMKLSGNTIIITGATSGIGRALALRFHALGNKIVAVGRKREKLLQMEGEMDDLVGLQCDMSDRGQVEALIARILAEHPEANVLINNAGVQYNYALDGEEGDLGKLAEEVEVNLVAMARLCQGLLPLFRSHRKAAIVNVGSGLAFAPKASAPMYFATKAAVHVFTQALRYQLEDSNVQVFELIPPVVDTPMANGRQMDKISTESLVDEFIYSYQRNQLEMNVGKVKMLRRVMRVWPSFGNRLLKHA
jgi:uncharacterized oxidoreductase